MLTPTRAFFAASLILLSACTASYPNAPVYTGLVPKGFNVPVVATPPNLALFRAGTVAIVVSQNFEKYSKDWRDTYERGGLQAAANTQASMASILSASGAPSEAVAGVRLGESLGGDASGIRNVTDPRRLTDEVGVALRRSFNKVVVATDFADALDKQAQYIALVDFHQHVATGVLTDHLTMVATLFVHDAKLNQVLKAEYEMKSGTGALGFGIIGALGDGMSTTVDGFRKVLAEKLPASPK